MKTLYIAGPITGSGDAIMNVRNGILAGEEVKRRGWLPFIPHLDILVRIACGVEYEQILEMDLEWVKKCDALLRLPGESPGADRECEVAKIVFSMHELPDLTVEHLRASSLAARSGIPEERLYRLTDGERISLDKHLDMGVVPEWAK
jgi:hypothetical protein